MSHYSSHFYESQTNLENNFSNDESSIHFNDNRRRSNHDLHQYTGKSIISSPLNALNKANITVGSPKFLIPISQKQDKGDYHEKRSEFIKRKITARSVGKFRKTVKNV